jgi:hypothetical protein
MMVPTPCGLVWIRWVARRRTDLVVSSGLNLRLPTRVSPERLDGGRGSQNHGRCTEPVEYRFALAVVLAIAQLRQPI